MKNVFALWLFGLSLTVSAQEYRLEQITIDQAILSNGTWKLSLAKPFKTNDQTITGLLIGPWNESDKQRNRLLGYATIAGEPGSTATISSYDEFKPGDVLIVVAATAEKPAHTSILNQLANLDLYLNKANGSSYYNLIQSTTGTKTWEDQTLAAMLADVKKVIPTATTASIRTFLNTVRSMPHRYWGRSLHWVVEYQQWVNTGAPDFSLLETLTKANDASTFDKIKKTNESKLTTDFLFQGVSGSVIHFAAALQTEIEHYNTINTVIKSINSTMPDAQVAAILYQCAQGLNQLKNYDGAADAFSLAAQYWQANNVYQHALALNKQAEALYYASKNNEAFVAYQKAVGQLRQLYEKEKSDRNAFELITALEGLADTGKDIEQIDQALQAYQEQLPLYKKLNQTQQRGNVYWNMGYAYASYKKQVGLSNQSYERAYEIFDSVKYIKGAVTVLCNQAINWRSQSDYKKALELAMRAEAYARANLNATMEGYALANQMETHAAAGSTDKALDVFKKAEKKYEEAEAYESLATLYADLATLHMNAEQYKEAAQASARSLAQYEKFATEKTIADAQWNAGYYAAYAGDLNQSNQLYEKAIDYYKDKSHASTSALYSNIGVNFRDAGDSTSSFQMHNTAIEQAVASADTTTLIKAHEKFYATYKHFRHFKGMLKESAEAGYLYLLTKNEEKTRTEYTNTVAAIDSLIAEKEKAKRYQDASHYYSLKAKVHQLLGDESNRAQAIFYTGYELTYTDLPDALSRALPYYKQAKAIYATLPDFYNVVIYIDNEIAANYKSQKKLDSAYYHLDLAIALGEKTEYWKNLADAYKLKAEYRGEEKLYDGPQGAFTFYEKAANTAAKIPDINKKAEILKAHAKLLSALKRHDEASKKHWLRLTDIDKKDVLNLADVYWDYGLALSYLPTRRKESNEYYLKAANFYKQESQFKNYFTLLNNIAINHRDAKDSVNAYKVLRDALKEIKTTKKYSKENLTYVLEKLGYLYTHFGHYGQAIKVRKEASDAYQAIFEYDKTFTALSEAGEAAEAAKQYTEAIAIYQKALGLAQSQHMKSKEASALFSIAYVMSTYQRKYKESIPLWEESYTTYLENRDTSNASIVRGNVGQQLWSLYDFDGAIINHEKAIALATQGKYYAQVASSWRKLADLYRQTKNVVKESEAIQKAIQTLEMLNDSTQLQSAYVDIGQSMAGSNEVVKAASFYNKALAIAQARKDSLGIASIFYKFGNAYYSNNLETASGYYRKAEVLQRKLKDKANLIYTIAMHGSLLLENNRAQAEKYMNEAMTIAKELKDNTLLAFCHSRMYDLNRELGKQTDVARKHWEESTRLYALMGEKNSVTNNYISLAYEYLYDYGDFTKAQEYMAKARVLLDSIKNPLTTAYFHGQQSLIYADQGQFDLALAALDQSTDIYRDVKNEWSMAGNYISYGNIYRELGEYALALKYQSMSDSTYHALGLEYQRYPPISNTGDVYFYQGDYPKALEYYKRALKYLEDNHDQNTNLCKIYSGVGLTYNNMMQYEEAEKWYKKALDVSTKIQATRVHAEVLNFLGKLKIETKQYEEAEKFLNEAKAFEVSHQLMIERTLNATNLGHLYINKGELSKAKAELEEAIALAEKFGKDDVLWEAYFRMGVYYRKSKNLTEARNNLLKSVAVIDKLRNKVVGGEEAKKLFSSDKWIMEAYEELIAILLEIGETEEAMAWLQKINENNVRDKIRSMDVTFEDDGKNKALAQEKELKLKLETLEKQIAAQKQAKNQNAEQLKTLESIRTVAESDYLKFVNQQVNVQPELSKYFSNTVQPSQLKGKKKQIPKDMALVSYLVGEKQLYIFVATSDTVVARIVAVPKEKIHRDVTAMVNIAKSHVGNFGKVELNSQEAERKELVNVSKQTDQVLKPFEDAYHYLISPVGELIANKNKLGVIATGELNYIPFQLLGKTLANGKFSLLINQYSLFYTNSTDMLLRGAPQVKDIQILAFGNPDKSLPATEKEVRDIQAIFPNTKVYVRDEATEDKAKYAPEQFNVMHFATHGNLDYEDFSKSYLTMAGNQAKNEDGMLTLEELWGMEVMSHLNIVVLSACQTAVTKGSDESSPVSPASGFLQNGVKSVVATLWKVDDEATSMLMNDFYKNIKTMDAVDAMRLAQSKLAANPKFSHPFYWAAMVLIGDWR